MNQLNQSAWRWRSAPRCAASSGKSPLRYPVGIVLNSAPLRVVMSFVIRVSGSSDFTKFFSTEEEAKAWVIERLDSR